jgi:hypothetical protein
MAGRSRKRVALAITVMVAAAYSLVAAPHAMAQDQERESRDQSIVIGKDSEFTKANGIRSGSGTPSDPYVISNWDVFEVRIHDTDKDFVITNSKIEFLTLNWNGNNVVVQNNQIGDLRVNENVRRTGGPTTGVITNNKFGSVGQLRHFDGVFAHNIVGLADNGTELSIPFFSDERAVNFDGFNGAHFFDNTLYGYLEVRLHGHHHSSAYGEDSHYHGTADEHDAHAGHSMDDMVDHTDRFHEVWVHDNTIYSAGQYALIYTDSNHAGNDRTASSEQNEELNKPHTHHTRVHLTDNKLIGSGLYVDIFNANDERHTETNRGLMEIARNDIAVTYGEDRFPFEQRNGITVWNAKDVNLKIIDNSITYDGADDPLAADDQWEASGGISLQSLDKADVWIVRNFVSSMFYGVRASDMSKTVTWRIVDLETDGVQEDVSYDQSVKNKPEMDH